MKLTHTADSARRIELCRVSQVGAVCAAGGALEMRLQAKNAAGWSAYSSSLRVTIGATQTPSHAEPPQVIAS